MGDCGCCVPGGYNLNAIATSAEACVLTLLGDPPPLPPNARPTALGLSAVAAASAALQPYWKCLAPASPGLYEANLRNEGEESEGSEDEEEAPTVLWRGPWLQKRQLLKMWKYGRKRGISKAIRRRQYQLHAVRRGPP